MLLLVLGGLYALAHAVAFAYFYDTFRRAYRLWSGQGVPQLTPTFPMGNLNAGTMMRNFGDVMHDVYAEFKRLDGGYEYGGLHFLNKPVLLVLSPRFARTVLVRDFGTFVNRGVYFDREVGRVLIFRHESDDV